MKQFNKQILALFLGLCVAAVVIDRPIFAQATEAGKDLAGYYIYETKELLTQDNVDASKYLDVNRDTYIEIKQGEGNTYTLETNYQHLKGMCEGFGYAQYPLIIEYPKGGSGNLLYNFHIADMEYSLNCDIIYTEDKIVFSFGEEGVAMEIKFRITFSKPLNLKTFTPTHRVHTNDGSNLRIRSGAGTRYNRIGTLPQGTAIQVIKTGPAWTDDEGTSGNWVQIVSEDGSIGWVFSGYLREME